MRRVALEHFYSRHVFYSLIFSIYSRHWGSKLENSIQMSNSFFFQVCCYAGGATIKKRNSLKTKRQAWIRICKEKRLVARVRQQQKSSHNIEREDREKKRSQMEFRVLFYRWGVTSHTSTSQQYSISIQHICTILKPMNKLAWWSNDNRKRQICLQCLSQEI